MYLVDTSVLVDFFKDKKNEKIMRFEWILSNSIPFGISAFTYQELLQGAKDEKEFKSLEEYLSTQKIYYPSNESFKNSAEIFFLCRRKGITIRSSIDVLIVATAIENNLILLHNDRDFKNIAKIVGFNQE